MPQTNSGYSRRRFLATAAVVAGASAMPYAPARAAAKYTRYNVTSAEGQKMLASYAKGVAAMLKLPADHPQNWFRNAFIHLMDCPHGNWWFYVWHRGYLGFFERTIRSLSGDANFAIPYWDWTQLPQIPASLFDGVLTPTDKAYTPFTENLGAFTSFIKKPLNDYWNRLSAAQRAQLKIRGYSTYDELWNAVTGFDPTVYPPDGAGISGNMAFANTCGSRYLSRANPKLDPKTTFDVSPKVITAGLEPVEYYNPVAARSFTSSKTPSHNSPAGSFSILEGFPHNKVHNCIGGVGPLDPGLYGNMTNFLSPVDPIFFMHHSNMDRLWDVWTRKQQRLKLPILPTGADLKTLAEEPFLFYVGGDGKYVGPTKAGDFFSTEVFDYDYQPGFGSDIALPPSAPVASAAPVIEGSMRANVATVTVPNAAVLGHLAATQPRLLVAQLTVARPPGNTREFDVVVNAPAGVTEVSADSPYYAGTVAFFGPVMPGMKMAHDATFAVPLPQALPAFTTLAARGNATLNVRLVPSHGRTGPAPTLKSISVAPQ
jgi:tyrosinase